MNVASWKKIRDVPVDYIYAIQMVNPHHGGSYGTPIAHDSHFPVFECIDLESVYTSVNPISTGGASSGSTWSVRCRAHVML